MGKLANDSPTRCRSCAPLRLGDLFIQRNHIESHDSVSSSQGSYCCHQLFWKPHPRISSKQNSRRIIPLALKCGAAIRPLILSAALLPGCTWLLPYHLGPRSFTSVPFIRTFHRDYRAVDSQNAPHQALQFHWLGFIRIWINRTKPSKFVDNSL